MTANDPLLRPFALKHLALRNRFLSTAHEPAYTEDGMPKTRYRLYHAEKAKGGVALTMIGGSAVVSPDSPPAFGNILLYKDEVVRWLGELADDVHAHGAAVMIQITHLGRRTSWSKADWLPVVAPSAIREPAHRAFPKAAEDWDIARIVGDYADAAERCRAGGMDGIEIECYGHLADQFWSPATNCRDDEYGGALENRMRFSQAVVRAIRQRVGADFIVGLRMVCDEDWAKGLSREEGVTIAQLFAAGGEIDFINVIRGHIDTDEALSHVIPGMGARLAPHLDFAGEVRAATRIPVFHAARIQDLATARHAVGAGKLDMVGMTRAHIADPHIARKLAEAPDLIHAMGRLRDELGEPTITMDNVGRVVSKGGRAMLRAGFPGIDEARVEQLLPRYLELYAEQIALLTRTFGGIDEVLMQFDARALPWGIVTNKPEHLARAVVAELGLAARSAALVGGDTLPQRKPDPAPLLHAAQLANVDAVHSIYVGDDARDIEAGRAAGMRTVAAGWGYLNGENPHDWGADIVVAKPQDLLTALGLD